MLHLKPNFYYINCYFSSFIDIAIDIDIISSWNFQRMPTKCIYTGSASANQKPQQTLPSHNDNGPKTINIHYGR